tara:strand:+ start:57 stop:473 length:417 start_codon:yes stop_codon:yes gene_type:complete
MSWKNNSRNIKKDFNYKSKKKFDKKKQQKKFSGRSIEVYNDDVNGAIRKLKKVLERMDFQKELSKREFYEKPSKKRKRKKEQAIKKANKQRDTMIMKGEWMPQERVGSKHLKGKREKRKAWMIKEKVKVLRRRGREGK